MCHTHYMYPTVSCQKYSQSTAGIITRLEAVLLTTERFTVQSVILDSCTFFMFTSCKNWILVTAFPQAKRVISFFQSWFYHVCVVYLKKKDSIETEQEWSYQMVSSSVTYLQKYKNDLPNIEGILWTQSCQQYSE